MNVSGKNTHGRCLLCRTKHLCAIGAGIVLLLFGWLDFANAQESSVRFDHISLDEGLSQSIVAVIHKDRKGFMWFGTESGLNKFDGYQFTVYKYNPFDSSSITNNQILAIYEDRDGNLWLGTGGGRLESF